MPESVKENNNAVNLKEEIDKVNGYKYSQSSKGSELIRKIVFAIIGSCWILIFAKGKYQDTFMGHLFLPCPRAKSGTMHNR